MYFFIYCCMYDLVVRHTLCLDTIFRKYCIRNVGNYEKKIFVGSPSDNQYIKKQSNSVLIQSNIWMRLSRTYYYEKSSRQTFVIYIFIEKNLISFILFWKNMNFIKGVCSIILKIIKFYRKKNQDHLFFLISYFTLLTISHSK